MKEKKTVVHTKLNLSKHIKFVSPAAKGRFTRVTKILKLTVTQNNEIAHFYKKTDIEGLNEPKISEALKQFDTHVEGIKMLMPPRVQKKIIELEKLQADIDVVGKFKTSLPLLSFILCYKMDADLKEPFQKLWLDMENGVFFLDYEEVSDRGFGDREIKVKQAVRRVQKTTIYLMPNGSYEFNCGAAICVDGAPDAYGPDNKGSDLTSSAGHFKGDFRGYKKDANGEYIKINGEKVPEYHTDTAWWAVITDNGKSDGKPLVKKDGYYISTTSYVYAGQPDDVQERYVNANTVPFSVLSSVSMKALGLTLGDLVYVYNGLTKKGKWTAFLETRNEDDRIGEVSQIAAEALGIKNTNPRTGGQEGDDITFIFYPQTSPQGGNFKNDAEVKDYIRRNGSNIDAGRPVDRNPRIPS